MTAFQLNDRLAADTLAVGESPLCLYRLMDDARWPWIILVPRRAGVTEIHQLDETDQRMLSQESGAVARGLAAQFDADTMNVAKLGNVVAQLHVHHVVRRRGDPGWPGPVWGYGERVPYGARERDALCARLNGIFQELLV